MESPTNWIETATIVVAIAVIRAIEWIHHAWPEAYARIRIGGGRAERVLAKRAEWVELVERARREVGSDRMILLRTSNGGGLLNPEMPIYSSIVLPHQSDIVWDRQLVDPAYVRMLLALLQRGELVIRRDDLDPSLLRDLYLRTGVRTSFLFLVRHRADGVFYLAADFEDDRDELSPSQRDAIRATVNVLRNGIGTRPALGS